MNSKNNKEDLKVPKRDNFERIKKAFWLKSNAFDFGANSFLCKPIPMNSLNN